MHKEKRHFARHARLHQTVFVRAKLPRKNEDSQVHVVKFFMCALDAQHADVRRVVNPGGINQHHRAHAQNFHGFFDRVCRGAGLVRNDGRVLPRQRVDEGTFPHVHFSKNSDVRSVCFYHIFSIANTTTLLFPRPIASRLLFKSAP